MSEGYILSLVLCGIIIAMLVVFFGYNLKVSKNQIQLKKAVKEAKKSDETQNEKLGNQSKELWEIRVKLESEVETLENTRTLLQKLLSNAKEEKKAYFDESVKLRSWVSRLRSQLEQAGIPLQEHDIDDEHRREEAILSINNCWKKLVKNGKISGKTQNEVLGENWQEKFETLQGDDITKEWKRLIELLKSTK